MGVPDKEENINESVAREAEFFDKLYEEYDEEHRLQNYKVPEKFIKQVLDPKSPDTVDHEYAFSLLGNLDEKVFLDYGAGDGWNTICFAKAKAKVWAIDISQKGVELVRKKAQANGVGDRVTAEVRNCYETGFPSDMFDRIYGGGILHHLDLELASREISRILKPDGIAVFYEPIRDTKVMDILKKIVLRITGRKPEEEITENEAPLTCRKIEELNLHFRVVTYRYFNVLSSANVLFHSENVKNALLRMDYLLMRAVPGYKKMGRTVVIGLQGPKKI